MSPRQASLLAYVLLVPAIVGLWLLHALWAPFVGLNLVQAAAIVLMIWARFSIGMRGFHAAADPTPGGLVVHGPYRFLRHPIYASILLFCWAAIAGHPSLPAFFLGVVIALALAVRIRCEEAFLRLQYPEYEAYAGATRRILPGVF